MRNRRSGRSADRNLGRRRGSQTSRPDALSKAATWFAGINAPCSFTGAAKAYSRRRAIEKDFAQGATIMDVQKLYRSKLTSADQALRDLPKRCSVLLGMFASQPPALVRAFTDRTKAGEIDEALVFYMHATPATAESLLRQDLLDVIKLHPFYIGAGERALIHELKDSRKAVFFVPSTFSEIPRIIRERPPFDAFLLQVAPMDRAGWFSFGTSGAYSLAGIERSKRV